jgi:hypothetical protein
VAARVIGLVDGPQAESSLVDVLEVLARRTAWAFSGPLSRPHPRSARALQASPAPPVRNGPTGDGTIVHLRLLPGLVHDYRALVERALVG